MRIEFDDLKNQKNIHKHHISIQELSTIFDNNLCPPITDVPDMKHSTLSEPRYLAFGWTTTGFYVKVWYTYRDGVIRIIGGRKMK